MSVTERVVMVLVLVWGTQMQYGLAAAPEQKFVAEGGAVVLSCDLLYDPTKALVWVESNYGGIVRRLPNSSPNDLQVFNSDFTDRVSLVVPDGVDLRIENVRKEDEGSYNCQQEGADPDGTSQQLIVASPPDPRAPTITGYSGEFLTAGSSLTLTCVSTGGKPPSDLTWWRDGTQLTASASHSTDEATSVLNIPALRPADNGGEFECWASQLALTQVEKNQVTLSITYGPQNVRVSCDPSDLGDLREGGVLECTCTADSNPAAWYNWTKNSTAGPLSTGAVVDQTAQTLNFSTLDRAHSGDYRCRATNMIGSATSGDIKVDVKYRPQNVRVTCDPSDLGNLWEGGALQCTCEADSNPPAQYNWTKGTEPLSVAVVDSTEGTLTFGTLHSRQSGEYMCTADNGIGTTNDSILINVKDAQPWTVEKISGLAIGSFFGGGLVIGTIIAVYCYCKNRKANGTRKKHQVMLHQDNGAMTMQTLQGNAAPDETDQIDPAKPLLSGQSGSAEPPSDLPTVNGSKTKGEVVDLPDEGTGASPKKAVQGTTANRKRAEGNSTEMNSNHLNPGQELFRIKMNQGKVEDRTTDGTRNSGCGSNQTQHAGPRKDLLRVEIHSERNGKGATEAVSTPKREIQGNPDGGFKEAEGRTRMPSLGLNRGEVSNHPVLKETADQPVQDDPSTRADPNQPLNPSGAEANTEPGTSDAIWDGVFELVTRDLPPHSHLPLALAVNLGLSDEDMNSILENTSIGKEDKLLHFLKCWHETNPFKTPLTLAEGLNRCKCDDLAIKVGDYWEEHKKM